MRKDGSKERAIEIRPEARALLTGGFTVNQALALVGLREDWKPRLPAECAARTRLPATLQFARWLYLNRRLRS